MKKIGLLTYHSVYNFGANLQALSTLWYFKKHGYDVKIINWRPRDLLEHYQNTTPGNQAEIHESFFDSFFNTTDGCQTDEEIARIIEKESMDAIVIGSDAVCRHFSFLMQWRPSRTYTFLKNGLYTSDIFPNPYWGSFYSRLVRKIPMILMSVSSQGTKYKYCFNDRKEVANSLKNFSFISVRDTWSQKVFDYFSYGEKTPVITPDPVFGFNINVPKEFVSEGILKRFSLPKRYIILSFKKKYSPSRDWIVRFVQCCNHADISVVSLPYPQEENPMDVNINLSLPISPLEWYSIIKHSMGYVGNNMHPIVVSMHNAIPFFSFDYYADVSLFLRKVNLKFSKIYDLLSRSGLLEYYVNVQSSSFHFPEPELVFYRVSDFNVEQAKVLAKEKENCYLRLMKNIEEIINI